MNAATFLSYCSCFTAIFYAVPLRIIFVVMAVMTHYNSSCQLHQDAWFTGMSMSSVSLEPQATEMAQWPCGAVHNAVCALACVRMCVRFSCLCVSSLWHTSVRACAPLGLCVGVCFSLVATVFALAQSNLKVKYFLVWFIHVAVHRCYI